MKKVNVTIVDYGNGNLYSVQKACESVGLNVIISADKKVIESADAIILPGVGAFADAMDNLKSLDLISPIHYFVETGKPLLGICLGMQLLLTESEEFGIQKGLNLMEGTCKKFPALGSSGQKIRVPQINWNTIYPTNGNNFEADTPLANIKSGEYMYFVHSYFAQLENPEQRLSLTDYEGIEYCSSIRKKNIFAFQFHPEKSGKIGLGVYQKFKELITK